MKRILLKKQDLIKDEIYRYEWEDGKQQAIIKYNISGVCHNMYLHYKNHYENTSNFGLKYNFYEATESEKDHLLACIEANKYVEPKEVINNDINTFKIW